MTEASDGAVHEIARPEHGARQACQDRLLEPGQCSEARSGIRLGKRGKIEPGRPGLGERRAQGRREARQCGDGAEITQCLGGRPGNGRRHGAG